MLENCEGAPWLPESRWTSRSTPILLCEERSPPEVGRPRAQGNRRQMELHGELGFFGARRIDEPLAKLSATTIILTGRLAG
jgi:hypothetical protein